MKSESVGRGWARLVVLLVVLTGSVLGASPIRSAPLWSGTGHFVTESIGYTDGAHPRAYTAPPNFRQASTSLNAGQSTIAAGDQADLYINFDYDTTGKTIYVVYTTDGSAPNKTNGAVVTATFSKYHHPNRTWFATLPQQAAGAMVNYVIYISDGTLAAAWGRISGAPADRAVSQYQTTWSESDGAYFSYTVQSGSGSLSWSGKRAIWLEPGVIAWNGAAGASYRLYYEPNGGATTSSPYFALTAAGAINGASYPKNPNTNGLTRLTLQPSDVLSVPQVLKGQVIVAALNSADQVIDASAVQIQGVLDALYAGAAASQTLGVSYSGGAPTVRLWAPTAQNVVLRRYVTATATAYVTHTMTLDPASGVWSVAGDASWDRQFYLFEVTVYVPELDAVVTNLVSDPYAVSLSADTAAPDDPRAQFANLNDADLKPAGWDAHARPPLAAPEDISIYELHIRDFSINDTSVLSAEHRGGYLAFTYDGTTRPLSAGMNHLKQLRQAGLTHVQILPAFDFATVPEDAVPRAPTPDPTGYAPDSNQPQAIISATRHTDGFNWGYDPLHFGAPDGGYASDPNGVARVREFRAMVQALHDNGLRLTMDVVYNHTAAFGQQDKSVLDKIVPGYYHRMNLTGAVQTSSCCADTASEYAMMEKLMRDTLTRWVQDYKVDGFRFDLMNLHTVSNMLSLKQTLLAIEPTLYLYGEGWDFGSAKDKGLNYARMGAMAGTGIGVFNDRLRDAAHGGYSTDPLQIRRQGFINGLSYQWNGYCYNNRMQSDLHQAMANLRSGLRGSGDAFTADPQEAVNYVEKHDNETLFDQNVFKLPNGAGDPGACGAVSYVVPSVTITERVRAQNLGLSLVALAQGVPFFHLGQDLLRSKSLDRNSYDSGDWFNKIDWTYTDNNFAKGLPPAWDNQTRWGIMTPLLNNAALKPAGAHIQQAAAHMREMLRVRASSPLFRLRNQADINSRVFFTNTAPTHDALIVMMLRDDAAPDLDPNWEHIVVLFNAHSATQTYTITALAGDTSMQLHPLLADGIDDDPIVQQASFNSATGAFTLPPRTTAVFVSTQTPPTISLPPSTIDWVGKLWPRGGVAHAITQGSFAPAGFDVYVQVYEPGITDAPGQGPGISCALHWGRYGDPWQDLPMSYNPTPGADVPSTHDEYKATIPKVTLEALPPGTYGFTAYCHKADEDKKWKVDTYDINGNPLDDDQGDGLITIVPAGDPRPAPPGGAFVHLFEWRWADIEKECHFLAQKGYRGVQVSPPQEHLVPTADMFGDPANDYPWWVRYQPVSYTLQSSRSGTLAEFQSMVNTCNSLGVDVIVDAVINHMTGLHPDTITQAGTAGTVFSHYSYPGLFGPADFNYCGTNPTATDGSQHNIVDYTDRRQVQTCELLNLADLKLSDAGVRARVAGYLQSLLNMGVKGFRIDAAKHIPAHELAAILDSLSGSFYVFSEVIDTNTGERVRSFEYTPYGDVTEFYYSQLVGEKFNHCGGGKLSDLQGLPLSHWLPSRFAVVFTDNHDNQRGHGAGGPCIVDHRDGAAHVLANVFALAHPYGDYVSVMSSYYWSNDPNSSAGDSKGPPSTTPPYTAGSGPNTRPVYSATQAAGDWPANCSATYEDGKWACEHRRPATAGMVGFRAATHGAPVTGWVNVSDDHIAFGRGDKGYVAINGTSIAHTRTYTTDLPSGYYCDVTRYAFVNSWCVDYYSGAPLPLSQWIVVQADGSIQNQPLNGMDAFAIHINASRHELTLNAAPTTGGSLAGAGTYLYAATATVTATTAPGYAFTHWEDAQGVVATTPVYSFVITASRALTAVFSWIGGVVADLDNLDTRKDAAPTQVRMGDALTYTITLSNSAPVTVTADVTDTLPMSLTLLSATPGYALSGATLSWSGLDVSPMSTRVLTIVARAMGGPLPSGYTLTNTALIAARDGSVTRAAPPVDVRPWRAFTPIVRRHP